VTSKARSRGRASVSRAGKKLYARLGLTPEASDQEVEKAHAELVGFLEGAPDGARRWARNEIAAVNGAYAKLSEPAGDGPTRLRRVGVAVATLAIAVGVVIGVYNAGGGQDDSGSSAADTAEPAGLSPSDQQRVAQLMQKLDANPQDAATLVTLGNIYFKGGDYNNAGSWMEQALAVEPKNVKARLALGASQFNLGDVNEARQQWEQVIDLDPENVEGYYDLGFLYLSKNPPEMDKAKRMWRKVVEMAPPNSSVAKTVTTHLEGLEKADKAATTPAESVR
jgi:cytochrome c-type biogenesis protein CcmH/NrfG